MEKGAIALVFIGVIQLLEFIFTIQLASSFTDISLTSLRSENPFSDLEYYKNVLTILAFSKGGLFIYAGFSFYRHSFLAQGEKNIEISRTEHVKTKIKENQNNVISNVGMGVTNSEVATQNIVTSERGRRLAIKTIDIEQVNYFDAIKNVNLINQ